MYKESITPDEIQKLDYVSFPGKIYVIDSRYFNLGLVEYTKMLGDVTDSLVLYNISGFADDRYTFKLAR